MTHSTSVRGLDPWTVYGEMDRTEIGWAIDVPDIGVLPPPGRYLGTVLSPEPVPVTIVIPRPARDERGTYRRIELDPGQLPFPSPDGHVALRFEAYG